ncbi:MAG: zf-HC2 domain-containing protein [Candidatus Latescibacterota bacterium]
MTPPDVENMCEWTLERIEAFVDADLSDADRSACNAHMQQCARCHYELEAAQATRAAIRSLPRQKCPDSVTDAVLDRIARETSPGRNPRGWLRSIFEWKPLRPAAAAAALVLIISMSIFISHRQENPASLLVSGNDSLEFSPEEVALAEAEVKWTIAYINQTGRRAGFTVRDKAIYPHVVVPVKQAVGRAADGYPQSRPQ